MERQNMGIRIALAGNPNCGKTTMFNDLTGANQYVGNWPGVTVEKKEGKYTRDKDVIITDLPGVYSLSPYSPEEIVTRDYLLEGGPDVVINLVDATNLERNLYLTTQVLDLGLPVVVALNMMDLVRKNGDKWEMVSVGPTTSMRMESFEREFIEQTGVKLVVGKGGMGPLTEEGCQKFKALHVIFPAGCAVLAATQVEEIEEVHWTELGMPESLWVCRVKEFGPLIVSIDTHGNNLIAENKKLFAERRDPIVEEICEHVHYIK